MRAGAQVIETNTFGANALRLEKYGLCRRAFSELNAAGVRVARAAAGEPGVRRRGHRAERVLPRRGGATAAPKTSRRSRPRSSSRRGPSLEAGVDALVVETIRQTPELRVAVEAAVEASRGPRAGHRERVARRERPHGRGDGGRRDRAPGAGVGREHRRRQLLGRSDGRARRRGEDGADRPARARGAERRAARAASTSAWSTCRRRSTSASTRGA